MNIETRYDGYAYGFIFEVRKGNTLLARGSKYRSGIEAAEAGRLWVKAQERGKELGTRAPSSFAFGSGCPGLYCDLRFSFDRGWVFYVIGAHNRVIAAGEYYDTEAHARNAALKWVRHSTIGLIKSAIA